jgi:hypothetical protein
MFVSTLWIPFKHHFSIVDSFQGLHDAPPHSLKNSNANLKMKMMEEGVGVRSLTHNTSRVEGRVGVPGWGLG